MPDPFLTVKGIIDALTRTNFKNLDRYFELNNQLLNFRHIEHDATVAESNVKIAHNLGYTPKDIILTRVVGTGTITFNYSLFDNQNLDVTFSGAVRFRAFIGSYWDNNSQFQETTAQTQQAKASV